MREVGTEKTLGESLAERLGEEMEVYFVLLTQLQPVPIAKNYSNVGEQIW